MPWPVRAKTNKDGVRGRETSTPSQPPIVPRIPPLQLPMMCVQLRRPAIATIDSTRPGSASQTGHRISYHNNTMSAAIDAETLQQYFADSPPTVVPLAIKPHFEALTDKEKLYAHHISL